MDDKAAIFLSGVLACLLVVFVFAALMNDAERNSTLDASLQAIETTDIRILMSEPIGTRSVRFATDEGFIIYYDGALYVEREQ